MHVAVLRLELQLPGCRSLKQKRGKLKPLLAALHREFNISAAEIAYHDHHTRSEVACAAVANDGAHVQRVLEAIPAWVERYRPDLQVVDHAIDLW